ncbi:MAG TPA: trigger factor [Syntrophaceticus sp.]|jgi:trigger factor|uniref:Trigger factor n=1 Tax=Syntrophaceticus schinkii TaxID=499207 RepID=A0A0B7MI68_9FIRM|nr:trigger factor [Syntrophaceticus schinkii]MDD2360563.1 trigger factor [Syntrophaceticus schinkii]MDD4675312.1 trigger factor [Syntrophaceticus schinkii]CEO90309.1 Trigger factor [Syntrophaceticus schinkii]HHY30365.1 trigger factor [Syntrophaceticus sp.]
MRATLESIEKNQATIHVEVEEEKVAEAFDQAYRKVVKKVLIPGFRKGKTPRPILEARLGKEVLYEEALEILLAEAYEEAVRETAIEPINKPEIDVVQMEEGKPFIFDAKVEVLPEVDLGEYKGVSAVIPEVKVGDDEIEAHLKLLQQRHARLVDAGDKPVDDGDVAVIELETRVDGDLEPRLSGPDQIVEVGAAKFIPGLEAHLLGMKPAEEKNITMNLPSVFQYEDLEGKEAEFKVKIIAVKEKEYPELDDDFAKDVSECATLDEFKEFLRDKMEETGHINARRIFKERVVEKVVDGVEVDIPETLLNQQLEIETNRFVQRLAMQRVTVDDYLKMSNKDTDGLREELEKGARAAIKTRLVLGAVAKAEGIKVTPEELTEEIDDLSAQYNVDADKLRADLEARNQLYFLEEGLLFDKVRDFLADNAVALTEEPPQEETGEQEEKQDEAGQEEPQPPEED